MATKTNPLDALFAVRNAAVEKANEIAERVSKARGNHAKSLQEWRENSEDAAAVEYREWEEKARAAMAAKREAVDTLGAKAIGLAVMSEDEVEAAKAKYSPLAEQAKKSEKLLREFAEMTGTEVGDLPELLRFSGKTASSGGSQTGIKRPRWDRVEINGEQIKGKKMTLSAAALQIKAEHGVSFKPSELLDSLVSESGTTLDKITDVSVPFTGKNDKGEDVTVNVGVFRAVEQAESDSK